MKRSISSALIVLAPWLLGCNPAPPLADATTGRAVVEEALGAWRNAATVETLRQGNSLFVAEPRWEAGCKLDGYEIVEQSAEGYQARCKVQLSLMDPRGNPTRETAEYLTTTSPKRTVTRVSEGW